MATETQAQIDRINTEVATQASKIAQLSTILDGKAGGGGGSGGVETCTVTVVNDDGVAMRITCVDENGVVRDYYDPYQFGEIAMTLSFTVVKNSTVILFNSYAYSRTVENCELVWSYTDRDGINTYELIQITGDNAIITLTAQ